MKEAIERPNPDDLLAAITTQRKKQRGGKLYLFIGMCPGVGKTYAMLLAAHEAILSDIDTVVGIAEDHGREETKSLLEGLEILPRMQLEHRGMLLEELDVDAVLERKPKLVLVDELAHTNAPGARHAKRWQDVFELLDAGIDVLSTLNVQHLESRKESVEKILGITVRETVPDSVVDRAQQIRLIDLSVPDLLKRLKEGKVYWGERAQVAQENFFKEEKLTALREIALRLVAEKVDEELQTFIPQQEKRDIWQATERLLVVVNQRTQFDNLLRSARKLASSLEARWLVLYIDKGDAYSEEEKSALASSMELARNLGAEIISITDTRPLEAVNRIALQKNITQILLPRPLAPHWWFPCLGKNNLAIELIQKSQIPLHILPEELSQKKTLKTWLLSLYSSSPASAYLKTALVVGIVGSCNWFLKNWMGYQLSGLLFFIMLLGIGLFVSLGPILVSAVLTAIIWGTFFVPPVSSQSIFFYQDIVIAFIYLLAAFSTGILSRRIRKNHAILVTRERRYYVLYQLVWEMATAPTKESLMASVIVKVSEYLNANCDVLLLKKDNTLKDFNENRIRVSKPDKELAVANWVVSNNKQAGWSTDTLSAAEALYLPLKGSTDALGVLVFQPRSKTSLSPDDSDFLFTVARQLSISLEREFLRGKARENKRLEEVEKLHKTLLHRSIEEVKEYVALSPGQTKLEKENLLFKLDNSLIMSRLCVGIYPLHKESFLLRDIVQLSLNRIEENLRLYTIQLEVAPLEENREIHVDKELFTLALANIILNAAKFSFEGTPIHLFLGKEAENVLMTVSNEGEPIAAHDLPRIFDKFYRAPHTPHKGVGIGLTVAKGIIRAHGGHIVVENKEKNQVCFTIELPLE